MSEAKRLLKLMEDEVVGAPRYSVVGSSDDVTTCDACGKMNLKKTVALKHLDSGEIRRLGSDCAALALRGSKKFGKEVAREADIISMAQRAVQKLGIEKGTKWFQNQTCQGELRKSGYLVFTVGDRTFNPDDPFHNTVAIDAAGNISRPATPAMYYGVDAEGNALQPRGRS